MSTRTRAPSAPARAEPSPRGACAPSRARSPAAGGVLELQRLAGNLAVGGAIGTEMRVGVPGGAGERHADAVANSVAHRSRPLGRRRPAPSVGPTVVRQVPDSVLDVLGSEGGQPLEASVRTEMEPAIGTDLAGVRVHTSDTAAASARELGAAAYTVGPHVVFGSGRYGRWLLTHELAHVAQQTGPTATGSAPVLQMAGEPPTARAREPEPEDDVSALLRQRLVATLLSSLLPNVGLPSTGTRLAIAVGRGMGEELATELITQGKGAVLLGRLATIGVSDVDDLAKGYYVGLAEGVVSPVTDLFGLAVFGEHMRNLSFELLAGAYNSAGRIGDEVQELLAEVAKLGPAIDEAWAGMKKKPAQTILVILGLPDAATDFAEKKAYELGKSGGAAIVASLEQPWAEKKPDAEPEPRFLTSPFAWTASKFKKAEEWALDTPWAKIGSKVGYAIGAVAIQVILLAFTEGIGNAIEQVAAGLGRVGAALGKSIGVAASRAAEVLGAIGKGIAVVEEAIALILGKALKPVEKLLEPILEPLGAALTKLRNLLRKLFGVAEKESAQLVEKGAAKTVGAADDVAKVGPAKVEPKAAPKIEPKVEPKAAPSEVEPPPTVAAKEPVKGRPAAETGPLPVDPDIGEGLLARRPADGHTYKVSESGVIYRCTRCDDILALLDDYRDVFARREGLVERLSRVEDLAASAREARRLGDPNAKALANQAADEAAALYRDVRGFRSAERNLGEEGPAVLTPRARRRTDVVRPLSAARVRERMESLAAERVRRGLPAAGSAEDAYTISRLDIGSESFFGVNAHDEAIDVFVNAQSATHAEGQSFQRAARSVQASRESRGVLYVDRELCQACGDFGAVQSLGRQLGLLHLDIYTPSGLSPFSFSIAGR